MHTFESFDRPGSIVDDVAAIVSGVERSLQEIKHAIGTGPTRPLCIVVLWFLATFWRFR
jgi:hypothetical protein